MKTQKALMTSLWHSSNHDTPISLQTPLSYADRLRIRQPGDAKFSLGPHADGGSVERWEAEGYGRGGVYDAVFRGEWEAYDPWEAAGRVDAVTDLYGGLGSCSMFRMFQGWLSMSTTGPGEGTLLVSPLVKENTVYSLLRPFFRPVRSAAELGDTERFLDVDNWEFTAGDKMTSDLQGATPGHGQEFPQGMHPHLELEKTMVHVPQVRPGDYVIWHYDGKCGPRWLSVPTADRSKPSTRWIGNTVARRTPVSCTYPSVRPPRRVRGTWRGNGMPFWPARLRPTSQAAPGNRRIWAGRRWNTSPSPTPRGSNPSGSPSLRRTRGTVLGVRRRSDGPTMFWGFEAFAGAVCGGAGPKDPLS